jgi:hypothetical protein
MTFTAPCRVIHIAFLPCFIFLLDSNRIDRGDDAGFPEGALHEGRQVADPEVDVSSLQLGLSVWCEPGQGEEQMSLARFHRLLADGDRMQGVAAWALDPSYVHGRALLAKYRPRGLAEGFVQGVGGLTNGILLGTPPCSLHVLCSAGDG